MASDSEEIPDSFKRLALRSMGVCSLIAFMGVLGYLPRMRLFGSISADFIPMAPSTAISFLLLSAVVAARLLRPATRTLRLGIAFAIGVVSSFALLKSLEYLAGTAVSFEQALVPIQDKLGNVPIGIMSPMTGLYFLIAGIGMLPQAVTGALKKQAWAGNLIGISGSAVAFGSMTVLLAYFYGQPFLYGQGSTVPMALTTAAAFSFLGLGMIAANGPERIPVSFFAGPSTRALLSRAFIPLVILAVLVPQIVYVAVQKDREAEDTVFLAAMLCLFAVAASLLVLWVGRLIGNRIDRVEAALRKSEERFRSIIETTQEGFAEIDPEGRIVAVNQRVTEIFGYAREELIGATVAELLLFPEDREIMTGSFESFRESADAAYEQRYRGKDGAAIWVLSSPTPLRSEDGSIRGSFALMTEITQRKKTEEALHQYAQIVSSSTDMLALLTGDFVYAAANSAYAAAFDVPIEEIVGRTASDVFGDEFFNAAIRPNAERCLNGEDVNYEEWFDFPGDDGRKFMSITYAPYRDENEEIQGFVVTARDITDRKKTEASLRKFQKLESLGILAGGIAHDFNNILSGILGNLSLARENAETDSELHELLAESQTACESAKGLTRQLLTFAEGGAPSLETTELAPILKNAGSFALRGSTSVCVFDIDEDLRPVRVDEDQMAQVLQNLIINAAQAMPDGGRVTLSASNVDLEESEVRSLGGGRYIEISVGDEGVGISEDQLQRIFDPYFSTKADGRGLGLATCHSIVQKHGGRIIAESTLEVGSVFKILLPAADPGELRQAGPPSSIHKGHGRILIMDDDAMILRVLGRILRKLGYESETAPNGRAALVAYKEAKAAGRPFDLVIMDLTIPGGMGGRESIEKLHEIDADAKAVVSSGYSNDSVFSDYDSHGFIGALSKPFTIEDVSEMLNSVFGVSPQN